MITLLVSAAFALEGNGRATVVWMLPEVPTADVRAKVEKTLGGSAAHAAWSDLAFTPTPVGKDDEARIAAVEKARSDALSRWDTFDVEREIAAGLGAAISAVGIVRDEADRKVLTSALLLQGAAATRLVPDARFATAEETAPYRIFVGSTAANKPLVDALALDPGGLWTRSDFPDAPSYALLGTTRGQIDAQAKGRIELGSIPAGVSVVIDGRPAEGTSIDVGMGRHYVHALVGGKVAGRQTLDVAAGAGAPFTPKVSREELDEASARVKVESKELPADVAEAIQAVGQRNGAPTPTFVATIDDKGRPVLLPYSGGAAFQKRSPVTFMLAGGVGGGIVLSSAFEDLVGTSTIGPAVNGDLSAELGIYNLAIYAGGSLTMTPTQSMRFANSDSTENVSTKAYFHPYGGLGVYLPRPDAKKPLLLIGADYGWMSPGAVGLGGKLSVGIPSGDGTWFRIELNAMGGTQMAGFPAEGEPTVYAGLRIGFGRKF